MSNTELAVDLSKYSLGWSDKEDYVYKPVKGLNTDIINEMSWIKGEPQWMLDFRLGSHKRFERRPRPNWGGDLSGIDFDDIYYYIKPTEHLSHDWDSVPDTIKDTYEKLGIPEAERTFLAGVTAQYESEVVYHRNRADLEKLGVLFCDMDTALREYPEIVKKYFGRVIPPNDNKFSALNSAVWSGGSFIYVPPGVVLKDPLQAYFRINAENMGQFERTLIIADEGSQVHYIEGCSAPTYSSDSLHSAVVEIIVGESARVTYTTIQNWSDNVYNLVTKRARVEAEGHMEWIDGNIGCLAEGSLVTTAYGTKPIEKIQAGDKVLSYDESTKEMCWKRVLAKKYSGMQPVRTIAAKNMQIRVTDNHPFYTLLDDISNPQLGYMRADKIQKAVMLEGSWEGMPPWLQPTDTGDHLQGMLPSELSLERVSVSGGSKKLETSPTWDIEVEGTGNFVAEGFVVHNSKLTMKYPAVVMVGPRASGEVLSVAYAGANQHQDTGAKMTHAAPETTSKIVSKSVSAAGGRTSYRGLVRVEDDVKGCKSHVQCDALILDEDSVSDTYPYMEIGSGDAVVGHEASVSKVAEDQLFYLRSRGLDEEQAMGLIVNGFIEPVTRTLPMEYAVEWSRLIEMQMEGSVG